MDDLVGVLLVCLVVATASCAAAIAAPRDVGVFVLGVYVFAVADVVAVVEVLSLAEAVNPSGLIASQATLALTAGLLVVRLRPAWPDIRSPLSHLVRVIGGSRVLTAMASLVALIWAYQAVLAVTVPANTWDALTYHLPRVGAWFHHGGVFWIPNAPTDRLNEFQPGAEELVLALVAATGEPWPYAIPQFLSACVFIASAYVASRALGFSPQAAVFALLLAATVPMVVMQSTTAQNDLVAAALIGSASAAILHGGRPSLTVAGIAVGVATGVKLTVLLAVPILVLLALSWGWRALRTFAVAAAIPLLTVGTAGLWRNLKHTGHLLGEGGGRVEHESDGALGSALLTSFRIGYRLLDLAGLDDFIVIVAGAGVVVTAAAYVILRRGGVSARLALRNGILIALPLQSPLIFAAIAGALRGIAVATDMNVNPVASTSSRFAWGVSTIADEDLSFLGFLGGWLVLGSLVVIVLGAMGRLSGRTTLVAFSLPVFIALLAVHSTYNAWLGRFLLVPLAIALPLLAYAWAQPFRITVAIVSALTLIGVSLDNARKPFSSRPWDGGRDNALRQSIHPRLARSTAALDMNLRGVTCVVAVVGGDDPSYLLFGPSLERRVVYANRPATPVGASPIVLGPRVDPTALLRAGWRVEPALGYWRVARPGRASSEGSASLDRCVTT